MAGNQILIVDDEIGIRELLQEILQDEGYSVRLAENAAEARRIRTQMRPDLVLLDIWMPDTDGITLLREWANNGFLTMPVVMMSGHGTVDTAVEATRIGAIDFLEKPIALQKLLATVQKALKGGVARLRPELNLSSLGRGAVIAELKKQLERVLPLKAPVLLVGEPGAGFEACAHFFVGPGQVFVAPASAEKALDASAELLQQSANGVLFLREIGKLVPRAQQGLMQVLARLEKYNIRLVTAIARPPAEILQDRSYDQGLFAALSGLQLVLPPLRAHREDIPELAVQILQRQIEERRGHPVKFDIAALNALRNHDWPGNLDQLQNIVSSLALTAGSEDISAQDVNRLLAPYVVRQTLGTADALDLPLREARDIFERHYFEHHIKLENGNMSRVAEKVGLERTHLYRKLKQLGIRFSRRQLEEHA